MHNETDFFDLILKGGECLLPNAKGDGLIVVKSDIGVQNGKIALIRDSIPADKGHRVIDVKGLHVLPGVIDSQVHFREPGLTHKEDLDSGTKAALLGGVTSIFEMPNTNPSTTTKEAFQDKLNRAKGRANCHYAFFMGAAAENAAQLGELEKLPHCSGVKIFMGSSTGTLLVDQEEVLDKILRSGKRRMIIHSEDEARLKERKHIALESHDVHDHPVWRDVETAMISTRKLLRLARAAQRPVHVLHISTGEEMEFLKTQKDIATVEVLPQHLTLFAPDCYDRLGTFAQQNPPIREKRHLDRIWQALNDGTVDVIGSDHAPHTREEKMKTYPDSPSGVPGVQTLVPILLNHVSEGRLSLVKFAELVTLNPRRVFGIQNKGLLQTGFDADFSIVDLKAERTIENKWIASKCGWTPFDGMKVRGWPRMTILKGEVAMSEDHVLIPHRGEPVDFL